ncbi:MAG: hypothetical protein QMD09_07385 [Desulfatibacillaceae bacterium]|nr:hypothetical protein [Desulfatibacillaceae bacterium]
MQCIDAVEGVLKGTISGMAQRYADGEVDDLEFARIVRTAVDCAVKFLEENKEIGTQPQILEKVLFDWAKSAWLKILAQKAANDPTRPKDMAPAQDEGHEDYLFDYLYRRGLYPE